MNERPFRLALAERWWALPDRQFRAAVTLLDLAEHRDGGLVVAITSRQLAARTDSNRTSLRRTLEALVAAGFCEITARVGAGGETEIVLRAVAHTGPLQTAGTSNEHVVDREAADRQNNGIRTTESIASGPPITTGMLCASLADHGDRGHLKQPDPDHCVPITGQSASISRARDQDLQRSGDPDLRSDLRSSDLEIITSKVPDPGEPEALPDATPKDARPKAKNMRTDPGKVPERAWAAADYLRAQIIAEDGASFVAAAPWKPGWTWTAGAGVRVDDGSRSGLRLSWANGFRLLHAWLKKAMRNVDPAATDEMAWEEIARAVYWLFHKQRVDGPRFVVQSPDALRDKWDRIKRSRENDANQAQQRGANGRPDPIQKRQWIPADEWGKR